MICTSYTKHIRTGLMILGVLGLIGMSQASTASADNLFASKLVTSQFGSQASIGVPVSSTAVTSDSYGNVVQSSKMVSSRLGKGIASAASGSHSYVGSYHKRPLISKPHLSW